MIINNNYKQKFIFPLPFSLSDNEGSSNGGGEDLPSASAKGTSILPKATIIINNIFIFPTLNPSFRVGSEGMCVYVVCLTPWCFSFILTCLSYSNNPY